MWPLQFQSENLITHKTRRGYTTAVVKESAASEKEHCQSSPLDEEMLSADPTHVASDYKLRTEQFYQ